MFASTSDFRGCDVHRTQGARDKGPHRLAHDTEPRRGDCILICIDRQPMRTFPRDPGISISLLCGHHTHEASEVKATTRAICTERAASHLNASTTKTLIRVYICYNSSFHHEYIPPPSTGYFSAVVVEHPVYWRVGDEIVDDPVQRVGFVDLVVGGWGRTRAEGGGPGKRRVEGAGCRGDGREGVRAAVNDRARSD